MTDKPSQDEWFLDEMTRDEFEKLSGEERLRKMMRQELKDLSGDELKAQVDEITKGAAEFAKGLRLSRLTDKTGK
jgi:hypothetical protein